MENECMLTTFDNPFDPFKDFVAWNSYDVEKGYNTCSHIARIAQVSEDMSSVEEKQAIENAIDEIILYDFMNIYKKVWSNKANPTVEGTEEA